jgi:hypothetical protein
MLEIYHRLLLGRNSSWFHVHHCRGRAQALSYPGSEGALGFSPLLQENFDKRDKKSTDNLLA